VVSGAWCVMHASNAAEPDTLTEHLRTDEADTVLLTIPNQLGVDCRTHIIEGILKQIDPAPEWR
jgi:hypothetical protein